MSKSSPVEGRSRPTMPAPSADRSVIITERERVTDIADPASMTAWRVERRRHRTKLPFFPKTIALITNMSALVSHRRRLFKSWQITLCQSDTAQRRHPELPTSNVAPDLRQDDC